MSGNIAPIFRDGAPVKAVKPPIRLFLSGGGHRASIGSVGAICALVDMGTWGNVEEVISVSGGSITNAALVRGHTLSAPSQEEPENTVSLGRDPRPGLKLLIDRMLDDRASLVATPTRKAILGFLAAAIVTLMLAWGRYICRRRSFCCWEC
jgi:hypothetical protein